MFLISIFEDLKVKYRVPVIPSRMVAEETGLTEAEIRDLVNVGVLQGNIVSDNVYVPLHDLAVFLGDKAAKNDAAEVPIFVSKANGLDNENVLLSMHDTDNNTFKEVNYMDYKGYVGKNRNKFVTQIKGPVVNGKRAVLETRTFDKQSEAEIYRDIRLAELQKQAADADAETDTSHTAPVKKRRGLTFTKYAMDRLNRGVGRAKPRTIDGYRTVLPRFCERIGFKNLDEITPDDLRQTFDYLAEIYSQPTLKRCFNCVKMLYFYALEEGKVTYNPVTKIKCPSSRKITSVIAAEDDYPIYSDEELDLIFEKSREYNFMLYTMFSISECTGMRPAELRALEWDSVDLEAREVRITQAVTFVTEEITDISTRPKKQEIISVTKSKSGKRVVVLSDRAAEALSLWHKVLRKTKNALMRTSKFVFPAQDGSFRSETSNNTLIQRFKKSKKLNDMSITFYKYRHLFCTRAILAGTPLPIVQAMMGDSTHDVVTKIYTHITAKHALDAHKALLKMGKQNIA